MATSEQSSMCASLVLEPRATPQLGQLNGSCEVSPIRMMASRSKRLGLFEAPRLLGEAQISFPPGPTTPRFAEGAVEVFP